VLPPLGLNATAYTAAEWSDLFVASAGASAALTGLVFVAVSINLERIRALATLRERALETVFLLQRGEAAAEDGRSAGRSSRASSAPPFATCAPTTPASWCWRRASRASGPASSRGRRRARHQRR
jgi:hypothetical protein